MADQFDRDGDEVVSGQRRRRGRGHCGNAVRDARAVGQSRRGRNSGSLVGDAAEQREEARPVLGGGAHQQRPQGSAVLVCSMVKRRRRGDGLGFVSLLDEEEKMIEVEVWAVK
ncbi:hypothetical protein M0R45_019503 [Rubus argutus]|uniref:Uncharacterized protein n=1 Tax=Rubus argutus TaxID=59490 RepID=A0AAW1X699_RUBAR